MCSPGSQGGLGARMHPGLIIVAALVALIGPTSFDFSQRAGQSRLLVLVLAGAFAYALLMIGDDANYEFIYFQF